MARKPNKPAPRRPKSGARRKPQNAGASAARTRRDDARSRPSGAGLRRLAAVALIALFAAILAVAAVVVLVPGDPPPAQKVEERGGVAPVRQAPAKPEAKPAPPAQATRAPTAPAPVAPAPQTEKPAGPAPATESQDSQTQVAAMPPAAATWLRNAVPAEVPAGQPMIAIVIDDMGVDRGRSDETVGLSAPLTLAYLAYAEDLAAQTARARGAGHELLVHVPMEPSSTTIDPGPHALLTGLSGPELAERIVWNLSQFDGYIGINNHMGSRATEDRAVMKPVMAELARRGLLFLDSRTSAQTVGYESALAAGIPALSRDVFLDHDPSLPAVRAALQQVEETARRQGSAVAIGHPKDATIAALAEWLPEARARGFALVPLSAIYRAQQRDLRTQ